MNETDTLGTQLQETLEAHELAVKRALESLGEVQEAVGRAGDGISDETPQEAIAEIGRRVEGHETDLRAVMETLDEHKRTVRELDDADGSTLKEAMERARYRARQEDHPADPTHDRDGTEHFDHGGS